jgi:hypothetical protein
VDAAAFKKAFFDTAAIKSKLDPAVLKALSKFGAFVRTHSRSSIKRKKGTSPPNTPPYAHQGDIKRILFGYDVDTRSLVVGPILYGSKSGAPENLEDGGTATRNGVRCTIRPRPFMKPAFDAELKKVGNNFKNLIR